MQVNPVIEKELKTKMRGWKAPALISIYLGFLLTVIVLYFLFNNQMSYYGQGVFNPRVALNAYNTLAFFQLLLILFITPVLTGGSISSERERQTLDLLLCTDFSTFKIITGKIIVSIAHVMLLITASLPILGLVFLYGGIDLFDILLLFFFYIVVAIMVASFGTFYSTVFKKTIISIVATYLTIFIFSAVTAVALVVFYVLILNDHGTPSYSEFATFLFSNPFFGFGSIIENTTTRHSFFDIFTTLATGDSTEKIIIKSWMINSAFNIAVSSLLIFISARRIKPVK
ncbi:UNVERIFIED_CONTAM: ABC-type transport system involved in multi-copper enzyme maturation permease subunit [Acetivibrio alkalicellulosi]